MLVITLSSAVRSNILNLLDTREEQTRSSARVTTGKRISGITDGPKDYFRANALLSRSATFERITTGIDNALSTVNAAIAGLDSVNDLLDSLLGTLSDLRESENIATLSANAVSYQSYRAQITSLATVPTFLGRKLLLSGGVTNPTAVGVNLDTNTLFEITVNTFNISLNSGTAPGADSQNGISLQQISGLAVSNFYLQSPNSAVATQADSFLTLVESQVNFAQTLVRSAQQTFAVGATVLQLRKDFIAKYKRILDDGRNTLEAVDTSSEGANLSALQTRQQLGVTALSISTSSERSLLSLFR
jgi:flagellin